MIVDVALQTFELLAEERDAVLSGLVYQRRGQRGVGFLQAIAFAL